MRQRPFKPENQEIQQLYRTLMKKKKDRFVFIKMSAVIFFLTLIVAIIEQVLL